MKSMPKSLLVNRLFDLSGEDISLPLPEEELEWPNDNNHTVDGGRTAGRSAG